MGPLLDIKDAPIETSVNIMDRVGSFLRDDGKFNDSLRFCQRAVEIAIKMLVRY